MNINYTNLLRACESDSGTAREIFANNDIDRRNFEPGRLLEECVGLHNYRNLRNGGYLAFVNGGFESAGATQTAAFLNIASQFSYQNVLDGFRAPEFVLTPLIPEWPAATTEEEKIPGITDYGDEVQVRPEGEAFAYIGTTEDWILSPKKRDRGGIAALTFEAIFNIDSKVGGRLVQEQSNVGKAMATNKERRAWQTLLDYSTEGERARYNWRNNGRIATYDDKTGSHMCDNLAASNALVNWTNLDTANQLFKGMTNPYNGMPLVFMPTHLAVPSSLEWTARRIIAATEVRSGDITSGSGHQTISGNPIPMNLTLLTSQWADAFFAVSTDWHLANITEMLRSLVVEKMDIRPAPPMNEDEYKRRVVAQWRVSEFQDFATVQPRAGVRSKAGA